MDALRPSLEIGKSIEHWNSFISDENAHYYKTIKVDIQGLEPMVTWGINPQHTINISAKIPILKIYLLISTS